MQGRLYRHRVHIDRFFESAERAGLDFSFLIKNDGDGSGNTIEIQKGKFFCYAVKTY